MIKYLAIVSIFFVGQVMMICPPKPCTKEDKNVNITVPSNCNLYIECMDGQQSIKQCPLKQNFDAAQLQCIDESIAKCEICHEEGETKKNDGGNYDYHLDNNKNYPGNNGYYPGNNEHYLGNNEHYTGNNGYYPGNNGHYPGENGYYPGNSGHYPGNNEYHPGNHGPFPGVSNSGGFDKNILKHLLLSRHGKKERKPFKEVSVKALLLAMRLTAGSSEESEEEKVECKNELETRLSPNMNDCGRYYFFDGTTHVNMKCPYNHYYDPSTFVCQLSFPTNGCTVTSTTTETTTTTTIDPMIF